MPFVTAADVQTLHDAITQEVTDLGNAVARSTLLDDATKNDWRTMRERAIAYLSDTPSTLRAAAQMDAGQQLERDLAPWYARLKSKGVDAGNAPSPPPAATDFFSNLSDDVKWIAIALVAWKFFEARR